MDRRGARTAEQGARGCSCAEWRERTKSVAGKPQRRVTKLQTGPKGRPIRTSYPGASCARRPPTDWDMPLKVYSESVLGPRDSGSGRCTLSVE